MKSMTIPQLKKQLRSMDKAELEELIASLYQENESVKESLNIRLQGEAYSEEIVEKYKKRLRRIFFPRNIVRTGFSLSEAKGLIREFAQQYGKRSTATADLKLCFAEFALEFTNEFGDIDAPFYNALASMYADVIDIAMDDEHILEKLRPRLKACLEDIQCGWGLEEELREQYDRIADEEE
ncbi:MAG: hypothetical protein IJ664_09325 [Clostridia bacterium]|nr:hypothetical protein [Clostridia bacterium]